MMYALIAPALLATATTPGALPQLSLEQNGALRCATALALTSAQQDQGDKRALQWPQNKERAREYFVRVNARLMDETGADRAGVQALVGQAARDLQTPEALDRAMPACLLMLEGSGI